MALCLCPEAVISISSLPCDCGIFGGWGGLQYGAAAPRPTFVIRCYHHTQQNWKLEHDQDCRSSIPAGDAGCFFFEPHLSEIDYKAVNAGLLASSWLPALLRQAAEASVADSRAASLMIPLR